MTNFKQIFAALALVAASSTVATAQTDFGSAMGAGGGAGGAFAPFVPTGGSTTPAATPIPSNASTAFGATRSSFAGASSTVNVPNAGGGNSPLQANVMQAIAGVLGGSPTAEQVTTFTNSLAGVPAGAAATLSNALQAFGRSGTFGNLSAAVEAYNAAIEAVPTGANPPAALAAVRFALFQASKN